MTKTLGIGLWLIMIGASMTEDIKARLVRTIQPHATTFAWEGELIHGIARRIAEHKLNIDPAIPPRRQKKRTLSKDRVMASRQELDKLIELGHV